MRTEDTHQFRPESDTAPVGTELLARPGLVERVQRAGAFCVVAGPAGYGKTALTQLLLRARPGAVAIRPVAGSVVLPSPLPPLIAVDDAHLLDSAALRALIGLGSEVGVEQVVLLGRPSLVGAVAMLDDNRRYEVIGVSRLGFERDEVREYLNNHLVGDVTEELVHEVLALTAGWPALVATAVPPGTTERELLDQLQRDEVPAGIGVWMQERGTAGTPPELVMNLGVLAVLRRFDARAVGTVLGQERAGAETMEWLREQDWLVPSGDGLWRLRAPWLREALRTRAQSAAPERVIGAQALAAAHMAAQDAERFAPDIVGHLLASQQWEAALATLNERADAFLERVSAERLHRWLNVLEEKAGELPFQSQTLLARVHAHLGQWNQSAAVLNRAQAMVRNVVAEAPQEQAACYARLAWIQAISAGLRGRATEAHAFAQRALMAVQDVERQNARHPVVDPMRFDLLRLEAKLLLESGKHDAAEQVLQRLIDQAESTRRKRALAIAHYEIGSLYLRVGDALRAIEHLSNALEVVDRQNDSDLFAQVETQRAQAHILRGEYQDARFCISNALSVRRRLGQVPALAKTLMVQGQIRVAMGDLEAAEPSFREGMEIIKRGADSYLRADVFVRCAGYFVDTKKVGEAIRLLESIREFVGDLRRLDPVLASQAEAVRGRVARLQGRLLDAQTLLEKAADSLSKAPAPFDAAQTYLWLAEVYWSDPPRPESVGPIRRYMEAACKLANEHEVVFGQNERFSPLLAAACTWGSVETNQYVRRVRGEAAESQKLELAPIGGFGARDRFRVLGPDGERLLAADELNELLSGLRPEHFAVVHRDGNCDIHHRGHVQSGELKRVVLPLLRALMLKPGVGLTAPELASEVWGETQFTQKARTRLKVAVSRLRELLGPDAKHLLTLPGTGAQRAAQTKYLLDTAIAFLWVEPA